jgi:hypothetical protein
MIIKTNFVFINHEKCSESGSKNKAYLLTDRRYLEQNGEVLKDLFNL